MYLLYIQIVLHSHVKPYKCIGFLHLHCFTQLKINLQTLTQSVNKFHYEIYTSMECKSQTIYKHNTGLYIGKGCFYYLPTHNLLVGCEQVDTQTKKQVKRNRKLFPDDLPFMLCGAGVGACSLWPNQIHKIRLCCTFYQPHQTLQKFGPSGMFSSFLHPILQYRVIY